MLKNGTLSQALGANHFDTRARGKQALRLVNRLQTLDSPSRSPPWRLNGGLVSSQHPAKNRRIGSLVGMVVIESSCKRVDYQKVSAIIVKRCHDVRNNGVHPY
jgi:hypothetical protein